jgi:nucleotide-binding universal stress UspA family protein
MAKRILVPVDGSPSGADVLPLVADLARAAGSTVRLISVKPVPEAVHAEDGRVVAYSDQEVARLEAEGTDFLVGLSATVPDVPVEHVVRFGDSVEEIVTEAEAWNADLVALTESPRRRWLPRRDLADVIHRKGSVPVVVYRPR